jgi:hypothetical protein
MDTMPESSKKELKNRAHIRNMLVENHVKESFTLEDNKVHNNKETDRRIGLSDRYSGEQYNSPNYKRNYYDFSDSPVRELPNASGLIELIKSEFVDDQYTFNQYKFNTANLPVTTRYPNRNTKLEDNKYLRVIKNDINKWNTLFRKYYDTNKKLIKIIQLKLIFVMETEAEFVVKVWAALLYRGRTLHLEITYYGEKERSDEFLRGEQIVYIPQLVSVKPIPKSDFDVQPLPMTQDEKGPFMSMDSQLQYVDRINKMHRDETGI